MSEHASHHNLAARLTASAAALIAVTALAACREADESAQGEPVRSSSQAVVDAGENATPADALANSIAEAELAWSRRGRSDAITLLKPNTIGADIIKASAEASKANEVLPKLDSQVASNRSADITRGKQIIAAIHNPIAHREATAYFDATTTSSILESARYGDLEPADARAMLKAVDPALVPKLSKTLDVLDAVDAVIDSYYDTPALNDELRDIADPTVSKLAKQAVKFNSAPNALDTLLAAGDKADATVESYSKKAVAADDRYFDLIHKGSVFDQTIQATIKKHNNTKQPVKVHALPKLADPGRVIDLTGLRGSKQYIDVYDYDNQLAEFAELYAEDGQVKFRVNADSNLSQASKVQMERLINDIKPFIESGFANGDLVAVRFTVDGTFAGSFRSSSHEAYINLSPSDPLSEEQFRTVLLHEVVHGLVNTAFSQELHVGQKEAQLLQDACTSLSSEAYNQYAESLRTQSDDIDSLIARSKGDDREIFKTLKKLASSRDLSTTLNFGKASPATVKDLKYTDCDTQTFPQIMVSVIGSMSKYDDKALDTYDKLRSRYAKPDDEDWTALAEGWDETLRNRTLYAELNEAAHVTTDSEMKEFLGHSEDNANEMMASLADVSLNRPEDVMALLAGLSQGDRETVKQAIKATYTIIANRQPALKSFLLNWQKQFFAVK